MNQEDGSEPLEFLWRDGPLRHPGDVVEQVAGILARFAIRFSRDELHTKTEEFARDAAIFVQQADVRFEKFRSETAARANDAVAEEARIRPRQKSETRDSAREINPFPAGAGSVFRQRSREHLQAGIEQRGMNPGAIGFSVGLGNRNRGGRKPHFSKRFAMSAPQLLNALETWAVFQAGISQGRVKLRGRFALRAPGPNFVQAVLFLGATNKIRQPPCACRRKRARSTPHFRGCRSDLRWNCKSGTKRCRSMPGKQRVVKCAFPRREESALPGTLRWIKPASRIQKVPSKPRAPFPDTRKREKRPSPELCGRSSSEEYRFRSCSGTAPWAERSSHALQAKRAPASPASAGRMHWADLPSNALARRDTLAEALSTAGRVHRRLSNRRWRRGRTTKRGW